MNYRITEDLLNVAYKLAPTSDIKFTCTNKDWRGREYQSDLVIIDEENHIGFEVFENEIIAYFFSDRYFISVEVSTVVNPPAIIWHGSVTAKPVRRLP